MLQRVSEQYRFSVEANERMASDGYQIPVQEHLVHANGADFWYLEAGTGVPLLLLHGGLVSNGPLWMGHKYSWAGHLVRFSNHFRVIALDTRGHGRTINPSGMLSYSLYAEDLMAVVEALKLDRPLIAGFSDGGTTATIIGMIAPDLPRALVNYAGYQMFNPDPSAPTYRRARTVFGGASNAVEADYGYFSSRLPELQRHIDDFEPNQGIGYFRSYIDEIFGFWTRPMQYTFADFRSISAPMLILTGDRDGSSSLDEALDLYGKLPEGELGIVPGTGHEVTNLGCGMMLDYLLRHAE